MLEKIICIAIVLIPILGQYTIFNLPVSIAEILLTILAFISIIKQVLTKKYITIYNNKYYSIFVLYIIFSSFLVYTFQAQYLDCSEIIKGLLRVTLYLILIMILINNFKIDDFYKYYKIVINLVLIILFIQVIAYYSYGIKINTIIPFFDLFLNKDLNSINNFAFRPSSLFLEPSWLSIFLLPMLSYSILKKCEYIYSIILFLALILSSSSSGILITLLIIFIKIFFHDGINKKKVVFLLLMITFVFFIINSKYILSSIYRLQQIGNNDSSFMRLYRGPNIYYQLPVMNKLFGVSMGNLANYINNTNYINDVFYVVGSKEFINDVFYILCISGLFGLVIYIGLFLNILYKSNLYLKTLVIIFLILSLTGPALTNFTWIFYMLLILSEKISNFKEQNYKINIKFN
ncbi:hypothetical protein F6J56_07915 [Clostridium perfringens]